MRTFCIILGSIAAVLGFLLSFIIESFAYIPVVAGLILGGAALVLSRKKGMRESVPKLIIALSFLAGAITTMNLFKEQKVANDVEQVEKEEKQKEKDLEEIEGIE
ncbi:hypothetical protein [uncultured Kordia sp.]|uniref:hypothetical protein n=1 Tax=uncultured Kordia sp. TaxID=507699 RepID=UPI00261DA58E|nr:hypothetical protein [uncultured Kordia sp.]